MRRVMVAFLLCGLAGGALAGDPGAPLGAPPSSRSAPRLLPPATNVIGKTAATRALGLRALGPAARLEPAGPLDADAADRGAAASPIERRLDCFESPAAPGRDARNRFLARCPANAAFGE